MRLTALVVIVKGTTLLPRPSAFWLAEKSARLRQQESALLRRLHTNAVAMSSHVHSYSAVTQFTLSLLRRPMELVFDPTSKMVEPAIARLVVQKTCKEHLSKRSASLGLTKIVLLLLKKLVESCR